MSANTASQSRQRVEGKHLSHDTLSRFPGSSANGHRSPKVCAKERRQPLVTPQFDQLLFGKHHCRALARFADSSRCFLAMRSPFLLSCFLSSYFAPLSRLTCPASV